MSGPLLTATLDVVVDGKPRAIPVNELTRVSFKHPKDTSVAGAIIGLLTLTLMEIVLGVDNIIFLAVVAGRLPVEQQRAARRFGLGAALGTRLLLLLSLTWLLGLTKPVFTLPELPFFQTAEARGISWRDLILLAGGVFLIGKSTWEMHAKVEGGKHGAEGRPKKPASFGWVIAEIAVIDIIFSLDSVITAVGMVDELWVMVTAVIVAVGIMLVAAEPISRFVDRRPTIKVLALSFLILIGVLLVAEGLGQHLNKGYIYFAMAFAIGVELVNMRLRPGSDEPLQEMPKTA
jgi:predicted tellurium resistance membrane protein TerC